MYTQLTGPNGEYLFDGLPPSDYEITVQVGKTYLYRLRLVDGGSFGPWSVRVMPGRLFLPFVIR